jgi:hypothetical protein
MVLYFVPALESISDSRDVAICRWAKLAFNWSHQQFEIHNINVEKHRQITAGVF